MSVDQVVEITREALGIALVVGLPILGAGMVVGFLVSLLQAVTQVQDQTLSFVPKIVAMALILMLLLPWMLDLLIEYSTGLYENIPDRL